MGQNSGYIIRLSLTRITSTSWLLIFWLSEVVQGTQWPVTISLSYAVLDRLLLVVKEWKIPRFLFFL